MTWTNMLTTREIYGQTTKIRPLSDSNFENVFYDRNKIVVVDFWAEWCNPCIVTAREMVRLADRFFTGPPGLVKFYHVELDPRVNPRLSGRFTFPHIPVVYFYYTATGRPPTPAAPLLEASGDGNDRFASLVHKIENIKKRHNLR